MDFQQWVPDMVIGVDFGMTCTGVAYSSGPDWPLPKAIQNWPGELGSELHNKVATAIAYNQNNGITGWGFLADPDQADVDIKELFKLYLDPAYRDSSPDAPRESTEEARRWFRDYLHCLYEYIKTYFTNFYPRWEYKNVEFVFSTPTTWRNPAMIAQIEILIKQAGFGSCQTHRVKMSLTEAEAAAVYASKSYERDDVILICDAGGGTTDLNVLKITRCGQGKTELMPLSWVEGEAIGSTLIDYRVENFIRRRLETVREHLTESPEVVAELMIRDRFERFKKSFGNPATNVPNLPLPVTGMRPGMNIPHARIEDSKMVISTEELRSVFDELIDRMFRIIEEQLRRLQASQPRENISYFVLSGGFGSSPYVKTRFKLRYETGVGGGFTNAVNAKVLAVPEPQLAVAYGLVIDRSQQISGGLATIPERCARNSYGVLCRQPYDPLQHQAEPVVIDPRDKKKWADRQIHWFIKQGQLVSVEKGIQYPYSLKIDLGKERVPWKTHIVMSSLPSDHLPRSMQHEGARSVCSVESLLHLKHMKRKNHRWYHLAPEYSRAEFIIKVIVGSADLKFQLLDKSGERVSKDHDEIKVEWDPPRPTSLHGGPDDGFGAR